MHPYLVFLHEFPSWKRDFKCRPVAYLQLGSWKFLLSNYTLAFVPITFPRHIICKKRDGLSVAVTFPSAIQKLFLHATARRLDIYNPVSITPVLNVPGTSQAAICLNRTRRISRQ